MSAKTNVVAIKPSDPAEALRSERASIIADLEAVNRRLTALAAAQKNEESIFAEIAKLGEKEIEAVKVWVAGECIGPQPQPEILGAVARLADKIGSGGEPHLDTSLDPAPALGPDALLAAAAARNQATNVLTVPSRESQ
jgi:hypothetical protein